jgi:preprotein translocase subunit SecE
MGRRTATRGCGLRVGAMVPSRNEEPIRQNQIMAKEKNATANPYLRELFQVSIYKRSQGRIARQVTFGVLALGVGLGAVRLSVSVIDAGRAMEYVVPFFVAFIGIWFVFRLVNVPSFADFLIAVEAEMYKVSWPTRGELFRSSMVVIFCIFFLAAVLFLFDLFWRTLLRVLQIVGN